MYPSYLEYFRERDSSSLVDFDYDRNLFEFEQKNSALPVLKGRPRSCLSYWHTIGANSFVIYTIKLRYRIPFISTPCQARFSNNQSALNDASFVESAIAELVHTHAVVEVPFIPHAVNPLSVSIQSSGKKRLILDLVMSIISFGNRSLGVKIGEFYYHMLIRAITFSVLISSLDITISIFFRITKLFWVSPRFFLVPFGIFVLHHFRSV